MGTKMNSMERVMTALSHKEPDRVPFFMTLTLHGAKELGMTIKEYYSKAENIIEGQLRLNAKYQDDALYGFTYASAEAEAWGGESIFYDDGPPNSGAPIIKKFDDINNLTSPDVYSAPSLRKTLDLISGLKNKVENTIPIFGVVLAPFSLPVLQLGFEKYFDLIYERKDLFEKLIRLNERFTIEWANAQLNAGASAIVYFDPVSSNTIVTKKEFLDTGYLIAKRTLAEIKGGAGYHFASGQCSDIIDEVISTGAVGVAVSMDDDLAEIKRKCAGKITVMGNLNAIEMRRWTAAETEIKIKECILKAGRGGGYLLTDNHGEIPWQVNDDTLLAYSESVNKWGQYPLSWIP